ncbi:ergothioneine biosynthesis protein EgtB [Tomitella biformata]|uniref:ergothioneine biosynthesis protein EgtB n=1 Tax=Tomitella biformata TaxID=630403 RepID=UPI0004663395|nr:ergothioneine biosynthesis protein EgtB [Tomitella biformata]
MTDLRARITAALTRAHARTDALTDHPDTELIAQHSPLMSPLGWDLAHIGNQEDRWLVRAIGKLPGTTADSRSVPEIDGLYDAFAHPRASRPDLALLSPAQARDYVARVRARSWQVLAECDLGAADALTRNGFGFGMIAQHEQQHAETMLATHQLRAGAPLLSAPPAPSRGRPCAGEIAVPAGPFTMGAAELGITAEPWALDNERPAHTVDLAAFAIDADPVINAQYAEFIDDGGYRRPELWSARGWGHRAEAELTAPQFWRRDGDRWLRESFGRSAPIRGAEPVVHVCYFEAEAFASWAGKRLPTEAEWEKAARWDPAEGRSRRFPWGDEDPTPEHANLGQHHLGPAAVGAYPRGDSALGVRGLIGDVWEWTSSGFDPYPGFAAFPYREYSEVFFGGDFKVLRGGSFGTDEVACRGTFRNWDLPIRRQIFAGLRCARSI